MMWILGIMALITLTAGLSEVTHALENAGRSRLTGRRLGTGGVLTAFGFLLAGYWLHLAAP